MATESFSANSRLSAAKSFTRDLVSATQKRSPAVKKAVTKVTRELLLNEPQLSNRPTRRTIAEAFGLLYQPQHEGDVPEKFVRKAIVDQFARLFYHDTFSTWRDTEYRGTKIAKCPTDLWIYQEMMWDLKPELVIETGTNRGGSAYFLADLCELNKVGRVITVDSVEYPDRPQHPRIEYLHGSSTSDEIVDRIRDSLPADGHVLVVLDSDHSKRHVLDELAAYDPMVTVGSYLVVEDTNVHHPVAPLFPGEGPFEAVEEFMRDNESYVIDRTKEKYMVTFNPDGFLRKVSAGPNSR